MINYSWGGTGKTSKVTVSCCCGEVWEEELAGRGEVWKRREFSRAFPGFSDDHWVTRAAGFARRARASTDTSDRMSTREFRISYRVVFRVWTGKVCPLFRKSFSPGTSVVVWKTRVRVSRARFTNGKFKLFPRCYYLYLDYYVHDFD